MPSIVAPTIPKVSAAPSRLTVEAGDDYFRRAVYGVAALADLAARTSASTDDSTTILGIVDEIAVDATSATSTGTVGVDDASYVGGNVVFPCDPSFHQQSAQLYRPCNGRHVFAGDRVR